MSRPLEGVRGPLIALLLILGMLGASCTSSATPRSDLSALPTEGSVPVDRPFSFEVGSHCGVGRLGLSVDGRGWITDEAKGAPDWIPPEWAATQKVGANLITVTVRLSTDRSLLTASLAGRSVIYRPVTASDPVVGCA